MLPPGADPRLWTPRHGLNFASVVVANRLVANRQTPRGEDRWRGSTFPFFEQIDSPRFRAIHRRLDAFWSAQGVPHLDLLPVYVGQPRDWLVVSRHDAHPSAAAHALAAERIGPFLDGVLRASARAEPGR